MTVKAFGGTERDDGTENSAREREVKDYALVGFLMQRQIADTPVAARTRHAGSKARELRP